MTDESCVKQKIHSVSLKIRTVIVLQYMYVRIIFETVGIVRNWYIKYLQQYLIVRNVCSSSKKLSTLKNHFSWFLGRQQGKVQQDKVTAEEQCGAE